MSFQRSDQVTRQDLNCKGPWIADQTRINAQMTLNLPPPEIIAHEEALHAIELPPLATFLTSLTVPDHLIKLNDILDRYRTPQSYHRIDVRELSSSELPLSSPEPEAEAVIMKGDTDRRRKRKRETQLEKGEPVILDEGDTVEEYKARRATAGATTIAVDSEVKDAIIATQGEDTSATDGGPSTLHPTKSLLTSTEINTRSRSPTPPTTVKPPPRTTSPPATHTLPPSGPKRRIRELRLDLRTLDPAALFALETWRRELLGLPKLEREHPDSIWYKDATPTPPPEPSPEPVGERRRPGRPRKADRESQSKSRTPAIDGDQDMEGRDVSGEGLEARADVEMATEDRGEGVVEQVAEEGAVLDIDAFDNLVDGPGPALFEAESTNMKAPHPIATEPTPAEKELTPPPSPDIIVVDGFNRADDDPDFSPEPSPEPVKRRGRARKSAAGPSSETLTPRSAFQEVSAPTSMGSSAFQVAEPPTELGSSLFRTAKPPTPMGSSPFTLAKPPTPMGSSLFQQAEEPTPMISPIFTPAPLPTVSGSSSRRPTDSSREADHDQSSRVSPFHRFSLSPIRQPPPLPPPPPYHATGSSDAPLVIPDSPEKRPHVGFVPFEREQMRIPTFTKAPVIPQRGLHWHDPVVEKGKKRKGKEVEIEERYPPAKIRAKGRTSKVHFAEFVDEQEDEVGAGKRYEEPVPLAQSVDDDDDDEWGDFKF